ncbi:MAG: hypothetical protein ACLSGS_02580 [Adlercreutzia sp.]
MAQSRRSFVKTAGTTLLVAGLTGMGLAGCSSKGGASESAPAADGDFAWDEETDVLVVGAGLAAWPRPSPWARRAPMPVPAHREGHKPPRQRQQPVFQRLVHERRPRASGPRLSGRSCHSDTGTPDDVLAAFATELTRNLD